MSSITIYLEGGGDGKNTKAALRLGMDAFLGPIKQLARTKSWHWKLVACRGRQQTYDKFRTEVSNDQTEGVFVLLVDAEAAVISNSPRAHLQTRDDSWDLDFATDAMVHLMVQAMETWIVADPDALAAYYGQRFLAKALPNTANLESVPRKDISRALKQATRRTQKGEYHKIRHASEILRRIDPQRVGQRCPACARLFSTLRQAIGAA